MSGLVGKVVLYSEVDSELQDVRRAGIVVYAEGNRVKIGDVGSYTVRSLDDVEFVDPFKLLTDIVTLLPDLGLKELSKYDYGGIKNDLNRLIGMLNDLHSLD